MPRRTCQQGGTGGDNRSSQLLVSLRPRRGFSQDVCYCSIQCSVASDYKFSIAIDGARRTSSPSGPFGIRDAPSVTRVHFGPSFNEMRRFFIKRENFSRRFKGTRAQHFIIPSVF